MAILTLTSTAKKQVKTLCENNSKYAVRLGIKGGGCAGFSYDWSFADESQIEDADELIQVDGGNLVIDSHSVMFLFGTRRRGCLSHIWFKTILGLFPIHCHRLSLHSGNYITNHIII